MNDANEQQKKKLEPKELCLIDNTKNLSVYFIGNND